MPRSRRRPAAAAKRTAQRRRAQGGKQYRFLAAPWLTWQEVSASEPGALAALELVPFMVDFGDRAEWTTLAGLAGLTGVPVAALPRLAADGYLAWDQDSGTAIATVPDHPD